MNNINYRVEAGNYIIASLTKEDRAGLLPHLEPVSLQLSQILYEMDDPVDYIYFPISGMCSLVSLTQEGDTLEVGIVGYEGMLPLAAFFGDETNQYRVVVQGEGDALRMRVGVFNRACKQAGSFQAIMLRYIQSLLSQLTQSALCNHFHPIEGRLCRWLLLSRDVVLSDELQLTQEFLAHMLGSRRAGVTVAAGALQNLGLIRYQRGHITIVDVEGLRANACECYGVVRRAFDKYLAA